MKILLVSFFNTEAYGLRILHSILTKQGYDVSMLFINEDNEKLISTALHRINPRILGISLVSQNFALYKKLYNTIRGAGTYRIVLGGWQPSLNPECCKDYCDIICQGEGEQSIIDIAKDVKDDELKRIYFNNLLKNIDYPLFPFDSIQSYVIENGELKHEEPYFRNNRYGTMVGRGCPYRCTYCSNSYMCNMYPNWSKIRYRAINHVIQELIIVKKNLRQVERINFYDEVFLPKKEWIKDFCIRYNQYVNLPFYCMFYPGTCNEDTAKLLSETGLKGVWLGIQSGSERVRKEIFKRYYTNETIFKQVDIFHKYNISVKYDVIFDNPFETAEETEETISLMSKLPQPLSMNMFSLKFFPNTEITKVALQKGIIKQTIDQTYEENPRYLISEERQEEIFQRISKYEQKIHKNTY